MAVATKAVRVTTESVVADYPADNDLIDESAVGADSQTAAGDFRILLVDDNEINQVVALGILEDFGLSAKTPRDGQKSIARLRGAAKMGSPYHLVFMDCQMPTMDGFTATKKIREG